MTHEELVKKIWDILCGKIIEEVPAQPADPEENLFRKGYISSLQLLDLVIELEGAFRIKIPHYEVSPENFETLNRLASYISKKL